MENLEENIELEWEEPKSSIDIAKFIVCHTYYFLRKFFEVKELKKFCSSYSFADYLASFKQTFTKFEITDKFSFDLMNSSYDEDSSIYKDEKKTKEDIFYQIKFKQFINAMNEQSYKVNDRNIIKSFISIRNCFIYLEYLYSFLQKYPEKIYHYIIKIHISFLLFIPEESAKRMINSDEFFYLNLVELKEIFGDISYSQSQFIKNIDNMWKEKFLNNINDFKNKKLFVLQTGLMELNKSLYKIKNDKVPFLIDYITTIYKNLSKDLYNNLNPDNLISKYITNIKDKEKKFLYKILNEINENGDIPVFNYLYLISLNNYNQLSYKTFDEIISNQINKNGSNIISFKEDGIKKEEIICDINNKLNEKEDYNSKKKTEDIILYENLKKKFERIMKIEELIIKIKKIEEKEFIPNLEEIDEEENDKFQNFINREFLYNKIFKINKDNIYEVLCFLMSLEEETNLRDIDNVYIEYKNKFVEKVKNIYKLDYNYFYDLIMDKAFYDDIINILNSKPIKYYLTSNRFYDEMDVILSNKNRNKFEFEFRKEFEEYIENLSDEYNEFMKEMENPIFFMNLFRLKYLPYKIRGITNSNLKIIVNALYYEFNKNINDNNKRIILSAALKILIVHEVMHILKYLKKNANFGKLPSTPRKRENGKMIINYLFGKPIINRITLEEAIKVNNIKYWDDVKSLRQIFSSEEDLQMSEKKIKENIDHIDLYITEEDQEDEKNNDSLDHDLDID